MDENNSDRIVRTPKATGSGPIIWSSDQQIRKAMPLFLKKLYHKTRSIIDCFECFTETPSGLNLAATLWTEHKHHYTCKVLVCKVLVAITPNSVSSLYHEPMVKEPQMYLLVTVGS